MISLLTSLGRLYLRSCPVEAGKWRVESFLRKLPVSKTVVAITKVGTTMELDTTDFLQSTIFYTGDWEPPITKKLSEILRAGDVFIDVGANIGFFSLYAAKLVGPRGRVISFEPNPSSAEILEKNIAMNGFKNITVVRKAVSNTPGELTLHIPANNNVGGASLVHRGETLRTVQVPVDTLDSVLAGLQVTNPKLIKFDIEGAELNAVQGGRKILSTPHIAALLEISERSLQLFGGSRHALFQTLQELGFTKSSVVTQPRASNFSDFFLDLQFDALFEK